MADVCNVRASLFWYNERRDEPESIVYHYVAQESEASKVAPSWSKEVA
jgi:hypothetical protein